MRKVIENQLKIGQTDIPNIHIDLCCRDEIPQLLLGLQHIYSHRPVRNKVFKKLKQITPKEVAADKGRPGMDLWKILVLGTLRLSCNWDFDKLHNIANEHKTVREFLGHTIFEFDQSYGLQTVKDNITLLTSQLLDEINQIVVTVGHDVVRKNAQEPVLKARCDSFVMETDVHYPTDINLLFDAIRKIVFLMGNLCEGLGITEWRQYRHLFKKIKKQFNFVRRLKHSSSKSKQVKTQKAKLIIDAHLSYVDMVESYVERANESIAILKGMGIGSVARIMMIENYVAHAQRQIDQIRRRVINDKTIPHSEKIFSIFEEHTESPLVEAASLTFLFTFVVVCGLAFYEGAGARVITGFVVLTGAAASVALIVCLIATDPLALVFLGLLVLVALFGRPALLRHVKTESRHK